MSLYDAARRVCEWEDICMLRKWTLTRVAKQLQGSQLTSLTIPHINLGQPPSDFKLDLDHMHRCTSCEMSSIVTQLGRSSLVKETCVMKHTYF